MNNRRLEHRLGACALALSVCRVPPAVGFCVLFGAVRTEAQHLPLPTHYADAIVSRGAFQVRADRKKPTSNGPSLKISQL